MLKAVCDKTFNGPFIYVRHAQTNYNVFPEDVKQSQKIRLEEKYLDCELSELGRMQAAKFAEIIKNYDIKYVFSSPLTRCLETCSISLKDHKDLSSIEVIVHPLLNEIISSTQTITRPIKNKKEKFSQTSEVRFNWDLFDKMFPDEAEKDYYFLEFVDNPIVETQGDLIRQIKYNPAEGQISQFLGAFWQHGVRPETFDSLYRRTIQFRNFLFDFIKEKQLKDSEKILIYTHSGFIRMCTSNDAFCLTNMLDFPSDGFSPKNCEGVSVFYEY